MPRHATAPGTSYTQLSKGLFFKLLLDSSSSPRRHAIEAPVVTYASPYIKRSLRYPIYHRHRSTGAVQQDGGSAPANSAGTRVDSITTAARIILHQLDAVVLLDLGYDVLCISSNIGHGHHGQAIVTDEAVVDIRGALAVGIDQHIVVAAVHQLPTGHVGLHVVNVATPIKARLVIGCCTRNVWNIIIFVPTASGKDRHTHHSNECNCKNAK